MAVRGFGFRRPRGSTGLHDGIPKMHTGLYGFTIISGCLLRVKPGCRQPGRVRAGAAHSAHRVKR